MKSFSLGLLVFCAVSSTVHGNEFDSDEGHKNFNHAFENWRNTFLNNHNGGEGGGDGAFFWPKLHFVEPDFRELDASLPNGRPNDAKDREPLDIDFISGTIGNPDVIETLSPGNAPSQLPQNPGAPFSNDQLGLGGFASFFERPFSHGFNGFPGFQFFNLRQNQPWWKGPNVCTEREEDQEESENSDEIKVQESDVGAIFSGINLNIESCVEKTNKHVCKKITNFGVNKRTVTVTHRCCQGYGRPRTPGMPFNAPCEKLNLRSMFDAAEHLGGKEFIKTAKNNELDKAVVNKTLFLPNDAAFSEFTEQMFENNLVVLPISRQQRLAKRSAEVEITSKDLILGHFVDGIVSVEDIQNEQLLTTNYGNHTIRMNIFPRPPSQEDNEYPYRYTANCVPLTKVNHLTEEGMIHMVERVIQPTTKSVLEIIQERNDMTVLRTVLEKTKMDKFLDENKHLTVFAPTDKAFEKLSPVFRRKLKEGSGCAVNIIKNHILDLTFCAAAVDENSHTITHNLLGEKIDMQMQKANQSDSNELEALESQRRISINKMAYMLETDIMATNGVVHVIDTILPTNSGLPVSTALQNNNLTVFQRLLEASGLEDTFDNLQNVTFFVPSDKAFETDSKTGKYWLEQLEANADLKDNAELKEFLENHIAEPLTKTCDLSEKTIKAKSGADLKVNLYTTHPIFVNVMNRATVNCARITNHDEETCGSVVHQVDKVLESPKMTILQTLEANKEYSMFLKFVKMSNLTSLVDDADKDLTLLVPKDDTFNEVQEWYTKMLANPEEVEHIVKSHIVPSALCCAGIVKSDWPFIRYIETLNGQQLKLNRDRRPMIANAGVTKCDVIAKNGVIHEINDIIATRPQQQAQPAQSQPAFFNQQLPSFW